MKPDLAQAVTTDLVRTSPLLQAISYETSAVRGTASAMVYVSDSFATMGLVYACFPTYHLTADSKLTYPRGISDQVTIMQTTPTGRAIGANRLIQKKTHNTDEDDTASFGEEMGIMDPQGALTMDELLDHEGEVWVVLKQHNKIPRQLLAVFPSSISAQY
jgi:hypothetical protein